jgi:uncharacterized protein YjiS (DUF1127 family)
MSLWWPRADPFGQSHSHHPRCVLGQARYEIRIKSCYLPRTRRGWSASGRGSPFQTPPWLHALLGIAIIFGRGSRTTNTAMLDLGESPCTRFHEPNIRSSIETAAAELDGLVRIVKLVHNLDDETLDKLAWRGHALINRIVEYRALSLADVLLKLELWRRLPADLWDSTRVIESATVDLAELRHRGTVRAPGAWPRPAASVHGGTTLIRLVLRITCGIIAWRARVKQRQARPILDNHILNDTGLSRMDVEREVSKPFRHLMNHRLRPRLSLYRRFVETRKSPGGATPIAASRLSDVGVSGGEKRSRAVRSKSSRYSSSAPAK